MDWNAAKSLVVSATGYDGATDQSMTTTAIGSPTDTRLQLLLRNFSVETYSFFTRATPVTFLDGDWEGVDLTDFSRCPLAMSKILTLNLNGTMLGQEFGVGILGRSGLLQGDTTGIPAKGTPLSWAESDLGKIDFDRPVDMSTSPKAWCMGWYRHPVLTADSGVGGTCKLDETLVFAWSKYAAIFLKENVTSGAVAMERLKRFDNQAFGLIMQKKSENLARYTRGLYGNNSSYVWPGFGRWM